MEDCMIHDGPLLLVIVPLETLTGFVYGTTPRRHPMNPASCCKSTVEDPRNLCSFRGEMTTLERAKAYTGF